MNRAIYRISLSCIPWIGVWATMISAQVPAGTPATMASAQVPARTPVANAAAAAPSSDADKLIYIPPRQATGAGNARVIASSGRDGPSDPPSLAVLSPDHVGLTVSEQPSLFFFLSKPATTRLIMTLMKEGDAEPTVELTLDATRGGIQRLDLGKQRVKLQPGVQYEISLALVLDPARRDRDICASGYIKRISPPDNLLADLLRRPKAMDRAILLAHNGVWYDALSIISDQIDSDSSDEVSRIGRAALLDQVALSEPAKFDRLAIKSK